MTTATTETPVARVARAVRLHPRRLVPLGVAAVLLLGWLVWRAWESHRPLTWAGTVETRDIAVGSRVGGRVQQVLVREGDRVKAGQPLVVLEPGDLPAQRLQAEGQLTQAQAALDKLVRGARPEEVEAAQASAEAARAALRKSRTGSRVEELQRARAQLAAAQASLDKAQRDAARTRTLFQQGVVTRSDMDAAEAAQRGALATRDAQQATLRELETGTRPEDLAAAAAQAREAGAQAQVVAKGSREEDIRAQQGVVEAARGRLQAIDTSLSELSIRAPADARVESLDLRPGDLLPPSATAATLVEDSQLYVRVYVPETYLGRLRVGQELPLRVDTWPHRTFTGVVEHINQVGEYTPRNLQTADERANQVFATRVGLRGEAAQYLKPGMAAYITVPR